VRLVTTIVALVATVARRDLGWPARAGSESTGDDRQ